MNYKQRLIVTRDEKALWTVLKNKNRGIQCHLQPIHSESMLRNVYVGKVRDIVPNIHAAFVDLGNGKQGFYSLDSNPSHLFTNTLDVDEEKTLFSSRKLRPGDEILVQVEREAVKTKDPVLTSCLNITGRYAVLTAGKPGLGISAKIQDKNWKKEAQEKFLPFCSEEIGFILRTNAIYASFDEICYEMDYLRNQFFSILKKGRFSSCFSLVYEDDPPYLSLLRDYNLDYLDAIITDQKDIYDSIQIYLDQHIKQKTDEKDMSENKPEGQTDRPVLRYYQDDLLPLYKLESLHELLEYALKKKVWLKSGGYLVIEPTEALTVIDVNTGKNSGKKSPRETIRNLNLEAAHAVGEQIRLRNISGIILIDFIDMAYQQDDDDLLKEMQSIVFQDPVKTTVVDMTPLHLMELTRKKMERPLAEQAKICGFFEKND